MPSRPFCPGIPGLLKQSFSQLIRMKLHVLFYFPGKPGAPRSPFGPIIESPRSPAIC